MAIKILSPLEPFATREIPIHSFASFHELFTQLIHKKEGRLLSLFAVPSSEKAYFLYAFISVDTEKKISAFGTEVKDKYPSLTPHCPEAHLFEREIYETTKILPVGHPWLKPVRFPYPSQFPIGDIDYFSIEGPDVHEVGVGPVHAGIIEPGHFRFQCYGEKVLHLEISLGYQHRGIEKALLEGPNLRTWHYMETLAGDTTIGHTLAYAEAIEALQGISVPPRAQYIRAIALELERLANHTGDLGAIASDVGYLPTSSYCGRLRGDFLNMTARFCGSRFGRNLLSLGGVSFDPTDEEIQETIQHLHDVTPDVLQAIELLWRSSFVMERLEKTGILSTPKARELGAVGITARASGLPRDVRITYPSFIYQKVPISIATQNTGDVLARANVRYLEIQNSLHYIQALLKDLPKGEVQGEKKPSLPPSSCVLSLVEGWRGEICHILMTNDKGTFSSYKTIDPSFHNWTALAMVLRDEEISNFPLCNKSFNLSYCGHDL